MINELSGSHRSFRRLTRSVATSAAWSLFGCGFLLGESFDDYSNKHDATSVGGVSASGAPGLPEAAAAMPGAGAAGISAGAPASVAGEGGADGGAAAGGTGKGSSCALPGGALITDMEGPWVLDPFYANPQTQRGVVQIAGFFCGRTSADSDQETESCAVDSQIEATTDPDQVHSGKTALKARANGTRRLLVKMDISGSFDASMYGGIHFWAKGAGPIVPGINGGGDWRGLPDLKSDVWQEYCLRWTDLVDSSTLLPRAFDGVLNGAQSIAFQVWDREASRDFLLLVDDFAFLPK